MTERSMKAGRTIHRRIGAALAICLIGWALPGCTTAVRPVVYRPSATRPRYVEYRISGDAARERYVTDGVQACYEQSRRWRDFRRGRRPTLEYQVQTLPEAADWQKFWRAVDRLQLARWRSSCSQFDVPPGPKGERTLITDLSAWTLTITTPQGSRVIQGDGAYPVVGHPEHVTLGTAKDARDLLEAAFRELVGLPRDTRR